MSAPVVDVVIPSTGRAAFVREAVRGILDQTLVDWTLVVAEDGRAHPGVADALAPCLDDPRVEYWPAGPKLGAARLMTTLVAGGRAPYLVIHHDDDRLGPGALERRVAFLERHPECGFAFSPHDDIDAEGQLIAHRPLRFAQGVLPRETIVPALLRANVVSTMHAALIRRDALVRCGLWLHEGFPRLYDWELWLRLALAFPVGFLETADADYRVHGGQSSARRRDATELLRLFEHGDRLCLEHAPGLRLPARERRARVARLRLARALDHVERGERSAALAELRRALRERPASAADKRVAAVLVCIALGALGRRLLRWARPPRRPRHRANR